MEVRLIEPFDTFRQLIQPWNELCRQSPDDHAFMRHEWFEHWLSSQELTDRLHMITAWRDGQLVGVLPLVWRETRYKGIPFRTLRFAESAVSPRCNALILSPDVLAPLAGRLTSDRRYQLLELQHLEADSLTTRLLLDYLRVRSPLLVNVSPGRQSPYLALDCSWDEYLQGLTSRRRYWIRNSCVKRLAESGYPHAIRFITDEAEADYLLDFMIEVSGRSWKADIGTAIGQIPSQRRLYTDFTKAGLARGLVEAVVLSMDGKPVAFDYYLRCNRRYSGIRCDFDRSFAQYRPGENLRIALIQRLTQSSAPAEVDFGGEVAEHKLQWANHIRSHIVIHAARPFSKGAPVVLWKKATQRRNATPSQDE